MVCSSFSKNFGLYRERVGALSVVSATAENSQAVQSQIKRVVRTNYSNPPFHGAEIVNRVLQNDAWQAHWEQELGQMRMRISNMRHLLVEKLIERGVRGDYSFITRQRGMFSYTGLTTAQVDLLREEHAVYIVGSGRINVAGINLANVDRLADALKAVVGT